MGLRDQLLKAGLISKKQAEKAEGQNKKHQHDLQKQKSGALQTEAEKKQELEKIAEQQRERQQLDKELNARIESEREKRAQIYNCIQMLRNCPLEERSADIPYYFLEDGIYVKRVWVTPYQREYLSRGKLGVGKLEDENCYVIIPRYTALKVQSVCPQWIIVLHSEIDDFSEVEVNE